MLNRAALVVRYRAPFLDWINNAEPHGDSPDLSLDEVNADCHIYLVWPEVADDLDAWLEGHWTSLFEDVLEAWYPDETLWPQQRDLALFRDWVDLECHSLVYDLGDGMPEDEEVVDEDVDEDDDLDDLDGD